jgi:hypothetical protein
MTETRRRLRVTKNNLVFFVSFVTFVTFVTFVSAAVGSSQRATGL